MKGKGLNLQFIDGDNFILSISVLYGQFNMTYFLKSSMAAIEFSFYNMCRCPLSILARSTIPHFDLSH